MDGTFRIKKVIRIAETEDSTDISNEKSDIKARNWPTVQNWKKKNRQDKIKLGYTGGTNLFKEEAENPVRKMKTLIELLFKKESEPANSNSSVWKWKRKNDELDEGWYYDLSGELKTGDEEEEQ